jgi:hypothetical protein
MLRLTSALVNFDFDIPTTSDEDGLEQDGASGRRSQNARIGHWDAILYRLAPAG